MVGGYFNRSSLTRQVVVARVFIYTHAGWKKYPLPAFGRDDVGSLGGRGEIQEVDLPRRLTAERIHRRNHEQVDRRR